MEIKSPSEYEKVPTKELISNEIPTTPAAYGFGVRHVQALLIFLCIAVGFMARAHLGVSVVAMTKVHLKKPNTSYIISNITVKDSVFSDTEEVANNSNDYNASSDQIDVGTWNVYRTYEWNKSHQEMILDSFFLGYSIMMFPMGMFCQRYGGKIPLQICLLVNGLISLVTPTVAVWGGWKAVCCCRILQGMSQSGLYPSTHTLLSRWVPIRERATFSSYVYTGSTVGTIISFQVGGLFAYSSAGWPSTFWFVGVICLAAFVLISILVFATPADHKTISDEEKNFILGCIDDGVKKRPKTPWGQILTSKHVWAAVISPVFCGICFVFLFTQIPTYMHYILGFDIKNSGLLSSLPYIASFFCSIAFGLFSDYCTNRGIVTLKTARIVCNSLAQTGPALCLVALTFTNNRTLAVMLLVAAIGLYSGVHTGWMVNYIDMSSNFSGSLMAMGNTGSALGSLSQPFLVANIVTQVTDRSQWRILLILMASIIFLSNVFYVSFISVETQPWNETEEQDDTEIEMVKK